MKTPFNLQEWENNHDIKVYTNFGESAKIVFTDGLGDRPILAVIYDGDTTDCAWYTKDGKDFAGAQALFFEKESEDERIPKALEKVLADLDNEWLLLHGASKKDILSWLEKQKDCEAELELAYKNADAVQYRKGFEDGVKSVQTEWSEEDEENRNYILEHCFPHIVSQEFVVGEGNLESLFKARKWLLSFRPATNLGWSDKDWNMRNNILVRLEALLQVETQPTAKKYIQNEIHWLRNIGPAPEENTPIYFHDL